VMPLLEKCPAAKSPHRAKGWSSHPFIRCPSVAPANEAVNKYE